MLFGFLRCERTVPCRVLATRASVTHPACFHDQPSHCSIARCLSLFPPVLYLVASLHASQETAGTTSIGFLLSFHEVGSHPPKGGHSWILWNHMPPFVSCVEWTSPVSAHTSWEVARVDCCCLWFATSPTTPENPEHTSAKATGGLPRS